MGYQGTLVGGIPGHLGGWDSKVPWWVGDHGTLVGGAMPWSAEKMLDGQRQRVDIPVYAKPAYDGLPQKRLEEDLC